MTVGSGNFAKLLAGARQTSIAAGKNFERLSSGLRINSASDDAAALSLSTALSKNAAVLSRGAKEVDNTTNLLSTAAAAVDVLQTIATSIQENVGQAQSSLLTSTQRGAIQDEVDALTSEYNRIVSTTTYNGQSVFSTYTSVRTNVSGLASDFVTAQLTATSTETVGTGSFAAGLSLSTGGANATNVVSVGDLNNDGHDDLVFGDSVLNPGLLFKLGNGDGTFGTTQSIALGGSVALGIDLGDVNGDGKLDVVASLSGTNRFSIALGNGNGTFGAATSYNTLGTASARIRVGDINGDGYDDVIAGTNTNAITYAFGSSSGTLINGINVTTTGAQSLTPTLGDVDGDGDLDLLNTPSGTNLEVYLNNGNGTFGARITSPAALTAASTVRSGDLNNDGREDAVLTDIANGVVRIMFSNGNGTFSLGASYAQGAGALDAAFADLNEDGYLDFSISSSTAGHRVQYLNNGNGTFSVSQSLAISSTSIGDYGDFNEDGVSDYAANSGASSVTVNLGLTTTQSHTARVSAISNVDVSLVVSAYRAASDVEEIAEDLTLVSGAISAGISRFSQAGSYARNLSSVNEGASEKIRDIDVATELTEHVKLQILGEAQDKALAAAAAKLEKKRVAALLQF